MIRSEEIDRHVIFRTLELKQSATDRMSFLRPETCLVSLSGRCGTDRLTDRYTPWLSITWIAVLEERKCSCQTEARAKIAGIAFTTKPDWN